MSQIAHLLHLSLLFLLSFHVTAQQQMNESSTSVDGGIGNFQPSLAVVIGILSLMFSLTFILLIYAKFCQRRASAHVDPENSPALVRSRSRFSGIDKTVIESLPFFRFSSLKGSKEGLECAVCLSKFEDIEILRLLPKCKHAFHIDCIDHWLERHSSCPLCRRKVSSDDPTMLTYSNSLRVLTMNQSENGEEPNIEIFVQREEDQSHAGSSSSRFRIGSSFRKSGKGIIIKEEELPIKEEGETEHDGGGGKLYHKQNHKINISDVVFKHRWSNVSSSDLMFLNSEMISSVQSKRFNLSEPNGNERIRASTSAENGQIFNIKEEMERKISFETKVGALNPVLDTSYCVGTSSSSGHTSKYVNPGDKRSMSEIAGVSRFRDLGMRDRVLKDSSAISSDVKEERRRQLWLPIARRTVQWFVNRERSQPLNVSFFHQ
ncbi:hypothetical protein K1719_009688 [Acacia pycnantha]|nr:hypothetical protein K1719_009688 [Acacia pycnantha]